MTQEALKQALEALEELTDTEQTYAAIERGDAAITAIKEALAQPQQKPVAGMVLVPYEPCFEMQEQGSMASDYDLSQSRAKRVYQAMIDMHQVLEEKEPSDEWFQLNAGYTTPPQPQQEPVFSFQMQLQPGWGGQYPRVMAIGDPDIESLFKKVGDIVTFYTSPPQRTWVGLTDDERDNIWHTVGNSDAHGDVDGWSGRDVMKALEAKLKEKNK